MTLEESIEQVEKIYKENRSGWLYALKRGETKYAERCKKSMDTLEQIVKWLSELQERRKQSKWTLISEEYPKIGQRVLVTFDDGAIGIRKCDLTDYFDCYYGDVIAWMPMPAEPYQLEAKRRIDNKNG